MRSLIRTSLLLLLITGTAAAQSLVTVNGPITDATAATFGGSVRIHLSAPCVYAGTRIEPRDIVVNYGTSGAFTVQLVPNDQCLDDGGGYRTLYTATWIPRGGVTRQENWNVLHTPGTTTVQAVITPTTPPLIQGAMGPTGATGATGPSGAAGSVSSGTFTSQTSVTWSTPFAAYSYAVACQSGGVEAYPKSIDRSTSSPVVTWDVATTGQCQAVGGGGVQGAQGPAGLSGLASCQPGLGDGLNPIPAGTYLQSACRNDSASVITITGIGCYVDTGSSTLTVTNGSSVAMLAGPVPCSPSWAAGAQSSAVTLAPGDYLKFTFSSDGTDHQTTWLVTITKP